MLIYEIYGKFAKENVGVPENTRGLNNAWLKVNAENDERLHQCEKTSLKEYGRRALNSALSGTAGEPSSININILYNPKTAGTLRICAFPIYLKDIKT